MKMQQKDNNQGCTKLIEIQTLFLKTPIVFKIKIHVTLCNTLNNSD